MVWLPEFLVRGEAADRGPPRGPRAEYLRLRTTTFSTTPPSARAMSGSSVAARRRAEMDVRRIRFTKVSMRSAGDSRLERSRRRTRAGGIRVEVHLKSSERAAESWRGKGGPQGRRPGCDPWRGPFH